MHEPRPHVYVFDVHLEPLSVSTVVTSKQLTLSVRTSRQGEKTGANAPQKSRGHGRLCGRAQLRSQHCPARQPDPCPAGGGWIAV